MWRQQEWDGVSPRAQGTKEPRRTEALTTKSRSTAAKFPVRTDTTPELVGCRTGGLQVSKEES